MPLIGQCLEASRRLGCPRFPTLSIYSASRPLACWLALAPPIIAGVFVYCFAALLCCFFFLFFSQRRCYLQRTEVAAPPGPSVEPPLAPSELFSTLPMEPRCFSGWIFFNSCSRLKTACYIKSARRLKRAKWRKCPGGRRGNLPPTFNAGEPGSCFREEQK